jgi:prepilin-type N-terminal cleavage/methylation domain-containing protein
VNGFTLIEALTVVAALGILVAMATPSIVRMLQRQETKTSATQMAGLLSDARARAVSEGTPHLVYFNPPTVNGDGECGAAAVEVRDADHSYSITDGDDTREFHLASGACGKVKQLDAASETAAAVRMPVEDLAVRAPDASVVGAVVSSAARTVAGTVGGVSGVVGGIVASGEDEEEDNSGLAEKTVAELSPTVAGLTRRDSMMADTVVNGATFPVDVTSGRPVIAFSAQGIPVDPSDPNAWGSGAGGIYLTDADGSAVFAALVAPLGEVKLRAYDSGSGTWK